MIRRSIVTLTLFICMIFGLASSVTARADNNIIGLSAVYGSYSIASSNGNLVQMARPQHSTLVGTIVNIEPRLHPGSFLFLFAAFVILLAGACALSLIGAYYIYLKSRGQAITNQFFADVLTKFRWPLWLLIATGFFLISNFLLIRWPTAGIWDASGAYYPYQVLVADHARAGRFVLWDLWSNAGTQLSGDPEVGAYSPLNFIIGFITGGTASGFKIYWLLMWWLGGFGVFMLARHLKAPPWGGCVVALGFLFCGVYTGGAQLTAPNTAFSFVPLIVWRLDAALCSRKLRPAVEAGALWGLSALAGYPGLTIITGFFAALWAVGRSLFAEHSETEHAQDSPDSQNKATFVPPLWFALLALAPVAIIGLVVLSPTYFDFFFEGAGMHTRVGALSREIAVLQGALHPGALTTFASPYLSVLKRYNHNTLWSYTDPTLCSIYSGAIISVLAPLAVFLRPRSAWRWWLACLAALCLASAIGQTLPLRGWLYDWVYPMRFFRHAPLFRNYYIFVISVLALVATRDLTAALRHSLNRTWSYFLTGSSLVAACAFLAFITITHSVPNAEIPRVTVFLGYTHVIGVWLGIFGVALTGWLLSSHLKKWVVPIALLVLAGGDAFLSNVIMKDLMIETDNRSVRRQEVLNEKHSPVLDLTRNGLFREECLCLSTDSRCEYQGGRPDFLCNDQMITKVPVLYSYDSKRNEFHMGASAYSILKRAAIGTDRIWFSKEVELVSVSESSFAAFAERAEELGAPPIVIHKPEGIIEKTGKSEPGGAHGREIERIKNLPAAEKVAVNLVKYSPDELVFNVQCPTDGWLLVTDRWARSWRAEVNGMQTPVYGGNFLFRAVRVSAGVNAIRFSYHPLGFPWLVIMSWGTLVAVAVSSLYFVFPRE